MKRLFAGLLAASLLLVASPAASSSAAATLPASTRSCSGVWVVVDRGNGEATTRCATSYRTGVEALRSAGFAVEEAASQPGYVVRIHGFPAVVDPTSFTNYWSYWHASALSGGTFSAWSYSSQGAGEYHPVRGSVEGWRFGDGGSIAPRQLPPRGYASAPRPVIAGTAKVGRTLRVKVKTWRPAPQRVSVRWYRSGKPISHATTSRYRLRKADRGKRISVVVTVSGSGLQTVTKASKPTKKVHR